METKRLRTMSAWVHLYDDDCLIRLVSYTSVVLDYDTYGKALTLYNHFDYSSTTRRHVRAFLKDYVGILAGIQDVREACITGKLYNLSVMRDRKHFNRG